MSAPTSVQRVNSSVRSASVPYVPVSRLSPTSSVRTAYPARRTYEGRVQTSSTALGPVLVSSRQLEPVLVQSEPITYRQKLQVLDPSVTTEVLQESVTTIAESIPLHRTVRESPVFVPGPTVVGYRELEPTVRIEPIRVTKTLQVMQDVVVSTQVDVERFEPETVNVCSRPLEVEPCCCIKSVTMGKQLQKTHVATNDLGFGGVLSGTLVSVKELPGGGPLQTTHVSTRELPGGNVLPTEYVSTRELPGGATLPTTFVSMREVPGSQVPTCSSCSPSVLMAHQQNFHPVTRVTSPIYTTTNASSLRTVRPLGVYTTSPESAGTWTPGSSSTASPMLHLKPVVVETTPAPTPVTVQA